MADVFERIRTKNIYEAENIKDINLTNLRESPVISEAEVLKVPLLYKLYSVFSNVSHVLERIF